MGYFSFIRVRKAAVFCASSLSQASSRCMCLSHVACHLHTSSRVRTLCFSFVRASMTLYQPSLTAKSRACLLRDDKQGQHLAMIVADQSGGGCAHLARSSVSCTGSRYSGEVRCVLGRESTAAGAPKSIAGRPVIPASPASSQLVRLSRACTGAGRRGGPARCQRDMDSAEDAVRW